MQAIFDDQNIHFGRYFRLYPECTNLGMARKIPPPKNATGLFHARTARGLSQDELALASGVKKAQISKLEKGERKFTREWAERFVKPLGYSAKELLFWNESIGTELRDVTGSQSGKLINLSIVSRVGAGVWREIEDYETPLGSFPATPHPDFSVSKQLAFEVEGDSMDLAGMPSGTILQAVEFYGSNIQPENGMIVVVEEKKDGGQIRRRTVKELHIYKDHFELRPRSTNPKHKTISIPIKSAEDPKKEITILAVVTQIHRVLLKPKKRTNGR